jgi:hypothetical protein
VEHGRWYRLGSQVMRRPLAWGGIALIALIALAAPVAGVRIGVPDDRVLPPGHSVRDAYDQLRTDFAAEPQDALLIVPAPTSWPRTPRTYRLSTASPRSARRQGPSPTALGSDRQIRA